MDEFVLHLIQLQLSLVVFDFATMVVVLVALGLVERRMCVMGATASLSLASVGLFVLLPLSVGVSAFAGEANSPSYALHSFFNYDIHVEIRAVGDNGCNKSSVQLGV